MIGKTLGRYRVLDRIGEGGMGSVYVAEDTSLHRKVALKVLRPEVSGDATRLDRFRREAQAVAALNHPNIVTIHSIEESPEGPFMTMELVRGKGLDQLVSGDGLSVQRMLEIVQPLVKALVAAHGGGITHRDLKPANIMVTDDGEVKILDFGVAKLHATGDSGEHTQMPTQTLTADGAIMGTVPYMSPEQVQGKPVDHRADIFSLGAVLYEMATGHRPFVGETTADVASGILRDIPQPIADTRPDIPEPLARIVTRCLEKEPELRYQSAEDIQTALAKVGE
ncbi:MAG: serine/threonine-protein kinase, partial [Acidobacteriota bacterium]